MLSFSGMSCRDGNVVKYAEMNRFSTAGFEGAEECWMDISGLGVYGEKY
jgi:hypothetical protein